MFKRFVLLLFVLYACNVVSQKAPAFGSATSHKYYVNQLVHSKDQDFQKIIALYNAHIQNHPNDVLAKIELCKFIGNSYWDEYEDYNLKYEETEECIVSLYNKYPTHPQVLIYRAENLYGEDQVTVLDIAKDLIGTNRSEWSNVESAKINTMLGEYYQEDNWRALSYYNKAQKLNDSLDLSLELARIYEIQGKYELAKKVLLPSLEKDTTLWRMNQKANLLLKLKEPQRALYLFDIIRQRDSTRVDNEEMAKGMTDLGNFEASRIFLVNDTINEWGKISAKQRLFSHDLAYSEAKIALETYRELQKESGYDDLFGIKRFRILLKDPFLAWNFFEVFHFFLLYILVLVTFLLPYLWVLPIFSIGAFLKKSGISVSPKLRFKWTLRHFWLVSFFYLLAQIITVFVFEYQDTLNYYFDLGNSYVEESANTKILANEMFLFVVFMGISTLAVLNRKKVEDVFRTNLSVWKMIGLSLLFVVFNRIFIKIWGFFVDLENPMISSNTILSSQEEITAVMSHNGFLVTALLVAVIVPIYEEIIFRGVILGVVEKHVGFMGANIVQAILFALVHYNLSLFPFFFVFAIITGYWVQKSGGLLTGIFFHSIHNFSILLTLYYLSRTTLLGG